NTEDDESLSVIPENTNVSWHVMAERKDAYALALPDSDENGHLIVEENKLAGDASLLVAAVQTVRASEAAPDRVVNEAVSKLIGTSGYPIHASVASSLGPVPARGVTIYINDQEGNAYEPPPPPP